MMGTGEMHTVQDFLAQGRGEITKEEAGPSFTERRGMTHITNTRDTFLFVVHKHHLLHAPVRGLRCTQSFFFSG